MKVSRRRLIVVTLLMLTGLAFVGLSLANRSGASPERARFERVFARDVPDVLTIERPAVRPGRMVEAGPVMAVVITKSKVWVLDGEGEALRSVNAAATAGAAGDVDGDGVDEILVAVTGPPQVLAMDGELRVKWRAPLDAPARRLLPVDFEGDGRREVVTADASGSLTALSASGQRLWRSKPAPGSAAQQEARGLDDVRLGAGRKERWPAVGYRGGGFAVMRADGSLAVDGSGSELRRLRTGDLDGDGKSELLIGEDGGSFHALDAAGQTLWSWGLGEAVGEIRVFEHDGDPAGAEVVLGGKGGALMGLRPPRGVSGPATLWSEALGSKITALAAIDCDGDGRDELFAGTESGLLVALRADGVALGRSELGGGELQAIRGVPATDGGTLVLAAAGRTLAAHRLERRAAPGWYRVEAAFAAAGFVLLLALVAVLWLPSTPPPAPRVAPAPEDLARRVQALRHERLERLAASGRLAPDRVHERRAQLEAEAAAARVVRPVPAAPPPPPPPPPPRRQS